MSIEAMRKALNYIENTEGELGIKLSCGDALREALAAQPPTLLASVRQAVKALLCAADRGLGSPFTPLALTRPKEK